jgi:hypothetical protein
MPLPVSMLGGGSLSATGTAHDGHGPSTARDSDSESGPTRTDSELALRQAGPPEWPALAARGLSGAEPQGACRPFGPTSAQVRSGQVYYSAKT